MRVWETQLPLTQINEDLSFLRSIAIYLSHTASQNGEFDFEAIAKAASRIKKHAGRLKDCLALPAPGQSVKHEQEKGSADAGQMKAELLALAYLISDAVHNPVLKGYLLDAPMSAKAMSDLNEIVELSRRIKMSSEIFTTTGQ